MADLDFVKVVGRFGITVGDSADPDDEPDIVWCDGGEITLEPLVAEAKIAGGSPVPWTGGQAAYSPTVDAEGYLTWRGQHYIKVVDLTSTKVNPRIVDGKATHQVTFKNITAGDLTVKFETRNVRLAADMINPETGECDLTLLLPVPVANSVPIVVGPAGKGIANLDVEGTDLVYELTDGTTGNAGPLPVGPGGSPTGIALAINDATGPAGMAVAAKIATLKAWAKDVDNLIAGAITYTSGLVSSAIVEWPDGLPGVLTILTRQSGTDAVTSYKITRVDGSTTTTYTQPTITRDSSGNATSVPQITVA